MAGVHVVASSSAERALPSQNGLFGGRFPRQGRVVVVAFSGRFRDAQVVEIDQFVFRQQTGCRVVGSLPVAHVEQYAGFESLHGIEGETVVEFSPFGCLQGQVVFDSQQFFGLLDVVENLLVDGRDVRRAVFLLDVGVGRQYDAAVRRRRGGIVGLAVDIYLDEFRDEIDGWVIDAIKAIGIDTAKAVLNAPREMLIEKTDLEEETVDEVIRILKSEFEEEPAAEVEPEIEAEPEAEPTQE